MLDSLGARLRRLREEQNIALATIAEQTKIKLSLLEALERDDVSHWPSGIFRRAYIRAYAHAIGLSPDAAVREFLEIHPDPAEDPAPVAVLADGANGTRTGSGPPTRLRYIVDSAFASLSRLGRSAVHEMTALPANGSGNAPETSAELESPVPMQPLVEATPPPGSSEATLAVPVEHTIAVPHDIHPDAAPPAGEIAAPETDGATDEPATPAQRAVSPDFSAVANLCTRLARVETGDQIPALLQDVAGILDATGLIVWVWNAPEGALRAVLAHGYSDRLIAQLPAVDRDADNATAAAFRTAEPCAIAGTEQTNGALALPLPAAHGCSGVLALELLRGGEHHEGVRAAATILAALLAQLIGGASRREGEDADEEAILVGAAPNGPPLLRVNARPESHARLRVRSANAGATRAEAAERARSYRHRR